MKRRFSVLCLVMIVGLVGYGTAAYITEDSLTTNVVTTGTLDIELFNLALDEEGNEVEFDTLITDVMPGDTFSQMPFVENTGTEDFYARVNLDVDIIDSDGTELPNLLEFNIDESKWVKDSEGWYRYAEVIESGQVVEEPLFTEVHFSGEMDNVYIGSTITINLQAQSVQAEHNEHENVLDVQGWSETGGGN